jgi:hypothetical protein
MKRKMVLSLIALLLLLLSYGFGYWNGFSHAQRGVCVVVARDASDSQQSSGKQGYEPYFSKQNAISDKVR